MNERTLEALGYKFNKRTFSDVKKLFSDDYRKRDFEYEDNDAAYWGAEHTGRPKLPNITVLPNLRTKCGVVLGSTFGHQHAQKQAGDDRRFQEIYEFHGYGAMLLRNDLRTALHIMKPGEKLVVGTGDNMTLFNLDAKPMITLDYANPEMNEANKDAEQRLGTAMLIEHLFNDGMHEDFQICEDCKRDGTGGDYRTCSITWRSAELGEDLLYKSIIFHRERFEGLRYGKMGVELKFGGNIPEEFAKEFDRPLIELALNRNKALFDALKMS